MTTYKYKNESKADLTIVGVGLVVSGETIELDAPINHPSLKAVKNSKKEEAKNDE